MSTFTNLITAMYGAIREVPRELNGLVAAVDSDFDDKGVAKDQVLNLPVTAALSGADFTPAATTSNGSDITPTTTSVTITKSRKATFRANAEQERAIENSGTSAMAFYQGQFAEAMRTLGNEVEDDLAALYVNATYAAGTAGTAPFASNFNDIATQRRYLVNVQGAPSQDLQMVIDGLGAVNLRNLSQLTKANEAGDGGDFRRTGELLDIHGFKIRESSRLDLHTAGSGSGYLINNGSGEAIGQTVLTTDTGTGTFVQGDVVTHASDSTNKYVASGDLSGNDLTLNDGLLVAAADNDALTIAGNYTANMCFHRSAIKLAARPPIMNSGVPGATLMETVTDPVTGLSFLVMRIEQYGQVSYEVHLAWGQAVTHPEWLTIEMG